VRRIESRRGKYNIPNVGIFLWRLGSYSVTNAPAFKLDDGRYLFDALGKDIQLYSDPQSEEEITHLAEPINVPMPLTRRVLNRGLETYYGLGADRKARSILLSEEDPLNPNKLAPIALSRIKVCNLSDLKDANDNLVTDLNGHAVWAHTPRNKIAIDPVLGRIAFPVKSPPAPPSSVRVTYHYGFSAEMGGGEYDREQTFVGTGVKVKVPDEQAAIQPALDHIATQGGVVEITESTLFLETPAITINSLDKKAIELRASEGRRPVITLSGDLMIRGDDESEVTINGFLIAGGRLRVPLLDAQGNANKLRRLRLRHCTLAPGPIPDFYPISASPPITAPVQPPPRLLVESSGTIVEIERCIVGPVRAVSGAEVRVSNSIVDAAGASAVAFAGLAEHDPGARLTIENSTVIGKVYTHTMKLASNTIFLAELITNDPWPAPVRAERLQQGCVRFSYVPPGSQLPRLHRCPPAKPEDAARVRPVFNSLRYGAAAYCQLSPACAVEITRGADDQAEIGAFHQLYQPQREANLRVSLDEYLRFGLEAGIFYAS
jgi:hypothetical protein